MNAILSASTRVLALALVLLAMPGIAQETADKAETVNINTASADRLAEALQGVGPVKAQAIVDWREGESEFTTPEHLEEVNGIGPATIKENRERIRLD
ncbi:ComEA family DNA-binding protein [Halomonadaceae bacterium KBTZ08]